ncbi:MAG: DNA polymerase/3'-5' exonuclease PolX [Candidatus Wildermuthbacteria bacterium]|nr:DNA polymerase/3'-5' exonuclease PolX [Candidatus Wildermuthbacteria bacterium]
MDNKELASLFSTIALYLEIEDVSFKPQAYERAAGVLETLQERVEDIYKREGIKGLDKIPGVGKGMAEKIEEYIKTGAIGEYEKLRKKIPVDIKELTRIEGVGPKMVRDLYKHLKIKTIADLEKAAKAGKVRKLPNFGERTEQNILQGIEFVKRSKGRWLLGTIFPYVEVLLGKLEGSPFVTRAVAAGSIRRMKETIGDVDILITSKKPEKAIGHFLSVVSYEKIWGKGATKVSVRTREGFDIDMRVLPEEVFGAGLQYFTGSKEHNVRLRTYAASKGYKLSEYGLFRGKKRIACNTEEDVYKALGMNYIEPELREDRGEIDAALRQVQGKLPGLPKVIPYGSLKGDLQVQTDWTDGKDSIEAMAREAKKQGLEYIAITDHTRDLAMTGGMDEKKLLSQMREIDKINEKLKTQGEKFRVLKGAEVNIRKDGTLDIADEVLAKLDVVGISVHSNFKMTKKDMTARIVKAMGNPHADILFHPTGRLIAKREAYQVDMDEVIATAKETGTILEINAFPERLDLADSNIKKAAEAGCKMAIDSDAHSISHLGYLRYGIAQARRGWAEQQDIINSYPLEEMLSLLK